MMNLGTPKGDTLGRNAVSTSAKIDRWSKTVDMNIQELQSKEDESFDSHSDSQDFDPNPIDFDGSQSQNTMQGLENLMGLSQGYQLMVVFDRSNDLVTPFVSQTSYIGILDDLLKGFLTQSLIYTNIMTYSYVF